MANRLPVFLLSFFLVCLVHTSYAAYRVNNVHVASDSLLIADSWAGAPYLGRLSERVSSFYQLIEPADNGSRVGAKPDNGRDGRRALTWSLLGLLFSPLGVVAVCYGIRGLKKGKKRKGLAIAGLILGAIEVCFALFVLFVALLVG